MSLIEYVTSQLKVWGLEIRYSKTHTQFYTPFYTLCKHFYASCIPRAYKMGTLAKNRFSAEPEKWFRKVLTRNVFLLLTWNIYCLSWHNTTKNLVQASVFSLPRSSRPEVFCKKIFLEISKNSQENTCARASFLIKSQACSFIKKDALAQVFSCEFYEIFKNTFFHRTPLVATSVHL